VVAARAGTSGVPPGPPHRSPRKRDGDGWGDGRWNRAVARVGGWRARLGRDPDRRADTLAQIPSRTCPGIRHPTARGVRTRPFEAHRGRSGLDTARPSRGLRRAGRKYPLSSFFFFSFLPGAGRGRVKPTGLGLGDGGADQGQPHRDLWRGGITAACFFARSFSRPGARGGVVKSGLCVRPTLGQVGGAPGRRELTLIPAGQHEAGPKRFAFCGRPWAPPRLPGRPRLEARGGLRAGATPGMVASTGVPNYRRRPRPLTHSRSRPTTRPRHGLSGVFFSFISGAPVRLAAP